MNKNIEFPQEERWENENIVKRVKKEREGIIQMQYTGKYSVDCILKKLYT